MPKTSPKRNGPSSLPLVNTGPNKWHEETWQCRRHWSKPLRQPRNSFGENGYLGAVMFHRDSNDGSGWNEARSLGNLIA